MTKEDKQIIINDILQRTDFQHIHSYMVEQDIKWFLFDNEQTSLNHNIIEFKLKVRIPTIDELRNHVIADLQFFLDLNHTDSMLNGGFVYTKYKYGIASIVRVTVGFLLEKSSAATTQVSHEILKEAIPMIAAVEEKRGISL